MKTLKQLKKGERFWHLGCICKIITPLADFHYAVAKTSLGDRVLLYDGEQKFSKIGL